MLITETVESSIPCLDGGASDIALRSPPSSNPQLLQPLDQVFFSRLIIQRGFLPGVQGLSKLLWILEQSLIAA
jgi:hypothetical protein